jgi:CDP-alcohol phosphatidyltransferase-like enzyme
MGRLVSRETGVGVQSPLPASTLMTPAASGPVPALVDLAVTAPLDGDVAEVVAQLQAHGVRVRSSSVIDAHDRLPAADDAALALIDGSVLISGVPLGALYDDPRLGTAALSLPGRRSLGLLRIAPADRPAAAALTPARGVLGVVQELEAAGVPVSAVPLGGYAWARPGSAEERERARSLIAGVHERCTRLREAARGGDGFYSTFILRKVSWRVTGLAERLGVTPNQVTIASFLIGLLAAGFIATGQRPLMVLGAVLLQICLVVDCVDGELARYRRRFSRFGAWLDATTDRVKEFAAVAAFAVAAHRHDETLWGLAAAAIALQTVRNLADLGWAAQRGPKPPPVAVPWTAAEERVVTPQRAPGPGAAEWLRRLGHFPVGERFLVMSVGALVLPPRVTLIVLLAGGLLAAAYLLAAFAVRSRAGGSVAVGRLVDSGLLLRNLVVGGRAGALLPAALAGAELGIIWLLTGGATGLLVVAVVAVAHCGAAYGAREGQTPGGPAVGTEVRLAVLAVAALLGAGWLALVLAAVVAVVSTATSLRAWTVTG